MFWHNFKYTLKTLLKNKSLIFWTFAFPILLATLYNMAFSNIEKSEKLSIIDIAIVSSDEFENNVFVKSNYSFYDDYKKLIPTKFLISYFEDEDMQELFMTILLQLQD